MSRKPRAPGDEAPTHVGGPSRDPREDERPTELGRPPAGSGRPAEPGSRPDPAPEDETIVGAPAEPATEMPSAGPRPPAPAPDSGEAEERIGHYRIVRTLGEGGMGSVYMAEQTEPVRRNVALKVIKLGMDTKEVVVRFEAERQALAVMDHPTIAKVYDAGVTQAGRPYFVMELVQGVPLDLYCDRGNLSTRQRLALFVDVCRGVQHAHQKGVIHRDLKPSNIIVTDHDGKPLPKIIDFGIAKATGQELSTRTLHTQTGQLLGTPEYMSPEQVELTGVDIDTRTDIYALGVILYELMTGHLPFDAAALRSAGLLGMQKIIQEQEPPRPSRRLTTLGRETDEVARRRMTEARVLVRQLKGDLDWIVMKALEKDRNRRYDTANALALEIGRYLNNEPVLARPPSAAYRVKKFVRRNYLGVAFGAALGVALIAGLVGTGIGFVRAQREAARATAVKDFLIGMLSSVDPAKAQGRDVSVREVLDEAAETVGEDFADQPAIEADVRETIGNMYSKLGLLSEAEPYLARALDIRETVWGEMDEGALQSMNLLALNYFRQKRHEEARSLLTRVVEMRSRLHGDDDPETLNALQNLASTYLDEGLLEDAEPLLLRVVEGRRRVHGPDHARTQASLANLASLYKRTGRSEEAEPLFVEILETRRETMGENHPRTLISTFNLANLYSDTERHDRAAPLYDTAAEGFLRVMGSKHPYTLLAAGAKAQNLLDMGRAEEARPLAFETYHLRLAASGPDSPDTLELAALLAEIYEALGDAERAAEWRSKLPAAPAGSDGSGD